MQTNAEGMQCTSAFSNTGSESRLCSQSNASYCTCCKVSFDNYEWISKGDNLNCNGQLLGTFDYNQLLTSGKNCKDICITNYPATNCVGNLSILYCNCYSGNTTTTGELDFVYIKKSL